MVTAILRRIFTDYLKIPLPGAASIILPTNLGFMVDQSPHSADSRSDQGPLLSAKNCPGPGADSGSNTGAHHRLSRRVLPIAISVAPVPVTAVVIPAILPAISSVIIPIVV